MVQIDYVRFYVEDAKKFRDWFVQIFGFRSIGSHIDDRTHSEIVSSGTIRFVVSSPLTDTSPVAAYLRQHPPGVADITFVVEDLDEILDRAIVFGVELLEPRQTQQHPGGCLQWCQIAAWGSLRHTLIQRQGLTPLLPGEAFPSFPENPSEISSFQAIDHAVLNVPAGKLQDAVGWYETVLGFAPRQKFTIATDRSSLHSQVMVHPQTGMQFPINEPTSPNSQIQEFLDANRGAGIQHLALRTDRILETIAALRSAGLPFLSVPPSYYLQLQQKPGFNLSPVEFRHITDLQILVDWQDEYFPAILLQTFTKNIFPEPTFFFEAIERRTSWNQGKLLPAQGFGEGNFRALFEAVEREQIQRGQKS
ncbi:MAG: 4-hydroxyphenylpyruvate dioxygenase [Geitlerinemataceae cyanobacterium]